MSLEGGLKFDFSKSLLFNKSQNIESNGTTTATATTDSTNTSREPSQTESTSFPKLVSNSISHDNDNEDGKLSYPDNCSAFVPKIKEFRSSSGQKILLKPKRQSYMSTKVDDIDKDFDHSGLIDISRLYTKLEIQEKVREEESKYIKASLKPKFTGRKHSQHAGKLWTEKYRPTNFFDIIGNEGTNRYILQWLSQWNEVALNKPSPMKLGYNNKNQDQNPNFEKDPFDRPRHRILLIHGAPGIGKTSIAHAIARQLDYHIQEINASDERSGMKVKEKVMNSLKNSNFSGKPSCLIIDEIDGASEAGFLKFLIDVINDDKKATQQLNNTMDAAAAKTKTNKIKGLLKRPIIALCNDVYANSLEKLKPHCQIVQLRKPPRNLILSTLNKICKTEGVQASNKFLGFLVDSTDGDLRNCINYLQFNSGSDSLEDSLGTASKDSQISWFLLLNDVFSRTHRLSKTDRFNKLFDSLSSAPSSIERVNNGCFNVMLDLENNNLQKLDQTQDYLYFNDLMNTKFSEFERTDLTYYNCVAPMKFYQLFNDIGLINETRRYSYKTKDTTFELRRQVFDSIRKMRYKNLSTNEFNLIDYELSLLNSIISPIEASTKVLDHDKAKLAHIMNIFNEYHLGFELKKDNQENGYNRYQQQKYQQKSYTFRPDLGLFNLSKDQPSQKRNALISRIHMEYLNQLQASSADRIKKRKQEQQIRLTKKANITEEITSTKNNGPVSTVDFFKSKYSSFALHVAHGKGDVEQSGDGSKENGRGGGGVAAATNRVMSRNEYRIWVKYHEGFSNAVRKEISWDDIF